jgi:hypothetical protein
MIELCSGPNRPKPNLRVSRERRGRPVVWDISQMKSRKRSSAGGEQKLSSLIDADDCELQAFDGASETVVDFKAEKRGVTPPYSGPRKVPGTMIQSKYAMLSCNRGRRRDPVIYHPYPSWLPVSCSLMSPRSKANCDATPIVANSLGRALQQASDFQGALMPRKNDRFYGWPPKI